MTDQEKLIWKASRGVPLSLAEALTVLFRQAEAGEARIDTLEKQVLALESRRGPGRPLKEPSHAD